LIEHVLVGTPSDGDGRIGKGDGGARRG
jgi:hypothetical protein